MALTGLDPNARTPGDYRELIFAQGVSPVSGSSRDVLIYGNKTSSGSETVDTIGDPIANDADAITRLGRRSEAYLMYRTAVKVDPAATYYVVCPTESAGTASSKTITFTTTSTDVGAWTVELIGESTSFSVANGDDVTTQATNCAAAINAASEGKWPVTASSNLGVVTVTVANKGPRGDYVLQGLRCSTTKSFGTTVAVSAVTSGTTEDDFTAAYTAAAQGEFYYQYNPKFSTSAPTSTDNGVGEGIAMITTQALPINGKSQCMIFGLVGTQAQSTTVATDSDANSVRAFFFHAENNDWPPCMIAAHCGAVMRSQQIAHPAANLTGYTNDSAKNTIFQIPDPYDINDRPTSTEIESDLKNGVTPIAFTSKGRPYIVRHITSRSLNAQSSQDYRASEGHIPSAIDFAWEAIRARWAEVKQPFCADEPSKGQKPLPKVSYPSSLKGVIFAIIDDLTSANPGGGKYTGPILDPGSVAAMKASVSVLKVAGGFSASADLVAVQHNNRSETAINEVGAAY